MVVPDQNGVYHDLLSMGDVDILVLNYRPSVYPWHTEPMDYLKFIPRLIGRILLNWKAARQLTSYLREHPVDIIHTNVSVIDIGFRAAKRLGVPHVFHIREYGDKDFYMTYYPSSRRFKKYLKWEKNYSICITKGIQLHYGQENCNRSRVIYNGIFSVKSQMPSHGQGSYFLFAGRIEAAKGLDLLMEAYVLYARRSQDPLPLYLAGEVLDHHLKQDIAKKAANSGLKDKLSFLGVRSDIEDLMSHALAVVITSPFEAFGRSMPEAMSLGCLAIARNTSGTLEQLENGLRFAGEDIALRFETAEQLSMQLQKASQLSVTEYEHITEKAWETVTHLYGENAYVNAVLSFYHEII